MSVKNEKITKSTLLTNAVYGPGQGTVHAGFRGVSTGGATWAGLARVILIQPEVWTCLG